MSVLEKSHEVLQRLFKLKENHTTVKQELFAALATFSTLAYAIILLPSMLSGAGMDFGSVMTATLLTGAYATLMMGLLANYPFILAPGIALSAYFSYSVVQGKGISWESALGSVFVVGVIFVILNLLKIRQKIIEVIPLTLRIATTAGLGIFLTLIGLKNAGIIVANPTTLVAFGDPTSPGVVMTGVGLIVICALMALGIPGAIFLGILFNWLLSLLLGFAEWQGLFALPSSLSPTFLKLNLSDIFDPRLLNTTLSFLFVSLFDTSGTLVGLAEQGKFLRHSGKKCTFPRLTQALIPDATGSIVGSLLGTSTIAVYLESAAGIAMGGRTGLVAIIVGLLFLVSLFASPFASSIPFFATTPALIIIGGLMLKQVSRLNWEDPTEWIPGFATLILIPLTYSVALGIAAGMIVYPVVKLLTGKAKEVHWLVWALCALFILKFIFLPDV